MSGTPSPYSFMLRIQALHLCPDASFVSMTVPIVWRGNG
ncbi:MAG: hypothetical protein AVDCRST_MAG56-5122 [uncultured Cytophagales bacterium]|uniref:Uncharacterized protein n=1 Tax=uncultured Cytophagales bacterium TaxID=158755 RepID=A0A6J4K749_9SPHI|nr:MAG: hypothetical protein AVDCRST_MAG56-5122 [uncultured Cytophagales bacterium]